MPEKVIRSRLEESLPPWPPCAPPGLGTPSSRTSLRQEVIDQQLASDVRSRIWFDRSTVWVTWLHEGEREAARSAERSGRAAIADTHLVWGAWLLHDAVRLGQSRSVVATLDELAGRVEGELVATMASHAHAAAGDDAVALERAASQFEEIGSKLLAAEAAAQAQQAYMRQGRSRLARVSGARAALMAARCPGVLTPPLAGLTPVLLTSRERQVARLASAGLTSRDLGDQLGISVRTVDNHLGSIYSKLGVAGRGELAVVLGLSSRQPNTARHGSGHGD